MAAAGPRRAQCSTGARAGSRCLGKAGRCARDTAPNSSSAHCPTSSRPKHALNSARMAFAAGSRRRSSVRERRMVEKVTSTLSGLHVLVVEDDYMIATDLAVSLKDLGVSVLGPAGSVADALALLAAGSEPDAAVL